MQKLFQITHLRTLQRLAGQSSPPHDITQLVKQLGPAPNFDALLHRLPREQLKHVLNMTCPINNFQQTDAATIVNSSKLLRNHLHIAEDKVCGRCPFAKSCSFASKPYQGASSENVLGDIIIFMGGLNDHLKPELIHYRQWVSAYKLGDSILACIEDLSKGGLEIAEHEKLRQEGIAQFKLKAPVEGEKNSEEEQLKKMEEHLKKVSKVAQIKREPSVPKQKIQQQEISEKEEFTFEEEPVFEPTKKFTKDSYKAKKSYKQQNSYEQGEEKGGNFEKKQRTPYKPRDDNFSRNDRPDRPDRPYKPYNREERNDFNQDRQYKKSYNQDERGGSSYEGNNYKKNYDNKDRYDRKDQYESRNYDGKTNKYDARDKYSKERSFNKYEGKDWQEKRQDSWKDKGQDRKFNNDNRERSNSYSEKPSRSEGDSYPNIKEYGKRQEYSNKPRDSKGPSPFVSKWQNDSDSSPRQRAPSSFSETPKSQPKIISMQSINESNPSSQGSQTTGRSIRGAGRRRTRE